MIAIARSCQFKKVRKSQTPIDKMGGFQTETITSSSAIV
jgi:hypothetical protein